MGHLMLRGRSDALSSTYTSFYIQILKLNEPIGREQIRESVTLLEKVLGSTKAGEKSVTLDNLAEEFGVKSDKPNKYKSNTKDLKMIHGLLSHQLRLFYSGRSNMFDYLSDLIQQTKVTQAYAELIDISNVGDKLAAFTLRDLVFLSTKCHSVKFQLCDYFMLFPVDTWVKQEGKELLEDGQNEIFSVFKLKYRLINLCKDQVLMETDPMIPLKLNAGLWYFGAKGRGQSVID